MSELTFGFIGLGLIGGSIARALKSSNHKNKIIAYDVNPDTLESAKNDAVADVITDSIDENFRSCDYIFLCAPVQKNDINLSAVKQVMSEQCVLTDVGSVKATIHEAIERADLKEHFIGGHPMAGSERTGYVNSKASLLENAYYILTPTDTVAKEKINEYKELVQTIGAIPLILDDKKHDYVTAAISHLPHVIASSLVNLVKDSDNAEGLMKMIAAGGFKDITRIASSSAQMWQQICLTNTDNIVTLLQSYIDSLEIIKKQLQNKDSSALFDLFENARLYRDSFINASSGPIKRSFSFQVDIADRPGALAHIVNLLADHDLSIKNIGITHNRESEDGVLRLELYDESSMNQALLLLSDADFVTHEHH